MYREPCASADGVGGSKQQTNDEVGAEDGERPSFDEGWRPFDESRGSNENIARLFGYANAHVASGD